MATYSFTLPTSLGNATGGGLASELDETFGRDIFYDLSKEGGPNMSVSPNGDWKIVDGPEALRQRILRILFTNPGEWTTKPEYGVGIRQYVKRVNSVGVVDELTAKIKQGCLQDRGVASVTSVVIQRNPDYLHIHLLIIPKGDDKRGAPMSISAEVR